MSISDDIIKKYREGAYTTTATGGVADRIIAKYREEHPTEKERIIQEQQVRTEQAMEQTKPASILKEALRPKNLWQATKDIAGGVAGAFKETVMPTVRETGKTLASEARLISGYDIFDKQKRTEDIQQLTSGTTGAIKNIGNLASGVTNLATGRPFRKAGEKVFGKEMTPDFMKQIDAKIDENGILNYKPEYANEAEKAGGAVAELGSWFIPITRFGKVGQIEKAFAEIPQVAKMLGKTPKLVKSGGKFFYEVSKDAVDIGVLDAIRGKDWETIKEDMKLGIIGGGVLRGAGEVIKKVAKKLKPGEFAPIVKEIQETTGKKLTAKETLEIKDNIEQGYTKEEIIGEITTPKRTELTSKPLKEESVIDVPKEEIKPVVEVKKQKPDLSKELNRKDYETILKSKIDEVPEPKKGEITVIQSGSGEYVDTQIDEALGRGVNKNTRVFNVKESKLKLTDNTEKNLRGERLLKTEKIKVKKVVEIDKKVATAFKQTLKEPQASVGRGESILGKRINEDMPDGFEVDQFYDKENIINELNKASVDIKTNKTKALKDAFDRNTKVSQRVVKLMELAKIAEQKGDYGAMNALLTKMRQEGTETAQALNMFKAYNLTNPETEFMKQVVNARLKRFTVWLKDIDKAKKQVASKLSETAKSIKESTKTFRIKDAQELFDKLICK